MYHSTPLPPPCHKPPFPTFFKHNCVFFSFLSRLYVCDLPEFKSQLEVLLGLKQPSIAAFSFLSDEDPVHPYYIFLKSWSGAALSTEYTRQQRLQAGRTEAPRRDEEQRKDREEAGAGAGAAGAAAVCAAADDDDAGATDANDAKGSWCSGLM